MKMVHLFKSLCLYCAGMVSLSALHAQNTIESCYEAAMSYAPTARQYQLVERAKGYNLENAARGWWPQIQFEAKAQVQSDVTELPFDLGKLGFSGLETPRLKKDQYAASLSLQQPLYEGGQVKAQKKAVWASADVEARQTDVALYALREQVNQLFFGILLTKEQLHINDLLRDNLKLNLQRAESMRRAGLAHDADVDVIRVEQLNARQDSVNYRATLRAYTSMLAQLTGMRLDESSDFVKPALSISQRTNGGRRPEMALYAARLQQLNMSRQQLDASLRPRLSFFAQAGYGRPGLNMLKDDFSLYGVAGLRLTWNISRLYTRKHDIALLDNQRERIRTDQDAFLYNQRIDEAERSASLTRYDELVRHDDEIIRLRENIRRASEARFAGGTLTATDLMRDVNDEQQARLARALHEMQRLLEAYNLRFTRGE